jgi:pilus assembly protein CpaF
MTKLRAAAPSVTDPTVDSRVDSIPDAPVRIDNAVHDAAAARLRHRLNDALSTRLANHPGTATHRGSTAEPDAVGAGVDTRRADAEEILADALRAHTEVELTANRQLLDRDVEQQLVTEALDAMFGLAGLQPLLDDASIENINVNGCDRVFLRYADGTRATAPPIAATDLEVEELVRTLAARSSAEERRFDRGAPAVSLQLADGSRLFAVMALTSGGRPSISIRRHRFLTVTLPELRRLGMMDTRLTQFLDALVRARKNLLITGGTAIGKTTLLRGLASVIDPGERLVTIEDAFELGLDRDETLHPDVVALQAREANIEGKGAVSQAELVRWALRMSPDRVIVGEIRGPEVIPMCNAMSQGNDGSMATLHASSSRIAFTRLASYAAQGPERLPLEATNLLVASAVHFVIHLAQSADGKRVVSSIREVVDADERQIISNEVYRPGPDRRAIAAAPLRTETLDELIAAGLDPAVMTGQRGWEQ